MIVGVKNRTERLIDGFRNWLPHCDELIVVDWSSDSPLRIIHPKIRSVRVINQKYWRQSKCMNFAASFAQCPILLKMDVDYRFRDEITGPAEGSFIAGRNLPFEHKYLSGFLMCRKEDFFSVGGYNERLVNYGYDDTDIQDRLIRKGYRWQQVDYNHVYHLDHPDEDRVKHFPKQELCIEENQWECYQNPWSSYDQRAMYRQLDGNKFEEIL